MHDGATKIMITSEEMNKIIPNPKSLQQCLLQLSNIRLNYHVTDIK